MLNMLLHSVFQGVQIGQVPEAILSFKWENTLFPESYFQRNAIFLHGNVEDRIRSLPLIFHINYGPGSCTSGQGVSARTSMEVTKNFSGKIPPGDSGKLPSDFVD